MHWHRLAAFLLGCLILGSAFMIFVATQNFATVDRVLADPPQQAAQMFQTLGEGNGRLLLRYLAGEENRLFFLSWELVQIAFGALLTGVLLLAIKSRLLAGIVGATVIVALFQHFQVTPQMVAIGRFTAFGVDVHLAEYNQFWKLHALYGALEVAKLALLAVATGILLFSRKVKSPDAVAVESRFANQA